MMTFPLAVTFLVTATLLAWLNGQYRSTGARPAGYSAMGCEVLHANRPPVFSIRALRKDYPSPTGPVTTVHIANVDIGEGMTAIVGSSGGG